MRPNRLRAATLLVAAVAVLAAALGIGVRGTFGAHVAVDETQYLLSAISLGEDGDLNIADERAAQRWRVWAHVEPPVQAAPRPDGSRISPHDPLLPLLLAVPAAVGGWIAAKAALTLLAGALAALTVWAAVRRFAVDVRLAAIGTGVAAVSAPLAVYGQQLYPELPAALACLAGVAALTGQRRRRELLVLAAAVVALPWLSVKYVPVAAVLAALGVLLWWRAGRRHAVAGYLGGLGAMGVAYLAVHQAVWGGWTVYASGDHFQQTGEFSVVGVDPHYWGRSVRLIGLLVDRDFGLVAWQPAWLLAVPALAALAARRPPGAGMLALPLATGWLVATFLALTMHGFWWPGRQVVVVLPLAVLAVLWWLHRSGVVVRVVAAVLGAAGMVTYGWLLADGYAREITWVSEFWTVDSPVYQALAPLLPDYRAAEFWVAHLIWVGVVAVLAAAGWWSQRRRAGVLGHELAARWHHKAVRAEPPATTFRPPRVGLVGLLLVAIALAPIAFAAPGLPALYLLPLGCAVWLGRTRTAVGPDELTVHHVLRTRRIAWEDVTGLRVDERASVRAVLGDGAELALPAVRPRDLPAVAAASNGRIADPSAADDVEARH